MAKKTRPKLTIIGYGRFGKLLSEILHPYADISIISRNNLTNKKIKQIDYLGLSESDWVIPAVPISSLEGTLKKISPFLKSGTLVMDVCSVKVNPCKWLKKHLPKDVELLGSHPMFGPDSAKKGLQNLQMVFCPVRIKPQKYSEIKKIFKSLKLNIIETTPEEHDKQNSLSLALVHFIGRGFEKLPKKEVKIATLGYKRLLQVGENVSNDTWQLFCDINGYNPYSKKVRKDFIESLQKIDLMLNSKVPENKLSLPDLRKNINKIDKQIFKLVEKRLKIVNSIGGIKKEKKLPIKDISREHKLIDKITSESNLDKDFIKALYKLLFKLSYKEER